MYERSRAVSLDVEHAEQAGSDRQASRGHRCPGTSRAEEDHFVRLDAAKSSRDLPCET
jgi:hypothetical protein